MAMMLIILCGSCLGFLRYNFSPAKIFMGDTGSMFLGLFFAYICTNQMTRAVTVASLVLPLLALGIPVFDVILAIWRRFVRRLNNPEASGIMVGDHDHLHHRVRSRQTSTTKAALWMYVAAGVTSFGALALILLFNYLPALAYMIFLIGVLSALRLADIEIMDSANLLVKGLKKPRKGVLLTMAHPLLDAVLMLVAFLISSALLFRDDPDAYALLTMICFVAPFILTLCVTNVYRTFWLRVGINRYYLLFKALAFASVMCGMLVYSFYVWDMIFTTLPLKIVASGYLLYGLLVIVMIASERFLLHYIESFGLRNYFLRNSKNLPNKELTLIYGGGLHCRLYLMQLFCRYHLESPSLIVGIVDDDIMLQKLNVYGFQVIGTLNSLEKIYEKKKFDRLLITLEKIPLEKQKKIEKFCSEYKVMCSYFRISEFDSPSEMLKSEVSNGE